ncbi:hypothetical protein [Rhodoferax sp. BLA1]|uniref:hypothetical protein n=1 Tax=Rhodoferax sp. BLA1 TaxID=2576062 RepID=UPI0015D226EC|nr:hypothetical protein [Rhodoferax sp. BLA1]
MFSNDEVTAHLLRESTRLKDAGDIGAALACLSQAKQTMLASPVSYPIETWCKYARYLLAAGKVEEAIAELQWLLDDLPRRKRKEYFVDDKSVNSSMTRSAKIKDANGSMRHPKKVLKELLIRYKKIQGDLSPTAKEP